LLGKDISFNIGGTEGEGKDQLDGMDEEPVALFEKVGKGGVGFGNKKTAADSSTIQNATAFSGFKSSGK
jgi:hypothetical protein